MGNLSFDVTREELIEAFSAAGKVVDAKVPTDRETGRPRGFAFIEFEEEAAVPRCIQQMHGQDLKGRPLRVNEAENRPPRPPGGSDFSRGPGLGFLAPLTRVPRGSATGGFRTGVRERRWSGEALPSEADGPKELAAAPRPDRRRRGLLLR